MLLRCYEPHFRYNYIPKIIQIQYYLLDLPQPDDRSHVWHSGLATGLYNRVCGAR